MSQPVKATLALTRGSKKRRGVLADATNLAEKAVNSPSKATQAISVSEELPLEQRSKAGSEEGVDGKEQFSRGSSKGRTDGEEAANEFEVMNSPFVTCIDWIRSCAVKSAFVDLSSEERTYLLCGHICVHTGSCVLVQCASHIGL